MLKRNKIFFLSLFCLALLLCSTDAYAVDILGATAQKAVKIYKQVKGIIFVFGAFGLVGVAFQAIFGKFRWNWFSGLAVGLAILAAAGAIAEYMSGSGSGGGGGASGDGVFAIFSGRTVDFAAGLQQIAFCLAGFGIIMFTFLAICGKINFKHLGYIMICLFFLSGTGLLISYVSGGAARSYLGKLNGFASPKSFTSGGAGDTYQKIGTGNISAARRSSI